MHSQRPKGNANGNWFDIEDAELFQLADAHLKAQALRYDVLPRMEILLQRAVARIGDVFGPDSFHLSTLVTLPAFRTTRRMEDVTHHYTSCEAGMSGKRTIVWPGIERHDGKAAKIFPFRLTLGLSAKGISPSLYCWWGRPYTARTHEQFHKVLHDHWDSLCQVLRIGEYSIEPYFVDVLSFQENMSLVANSEDPTWWVSRPPEPFPFSSRHTERLVNGMVLLYPLYDALVRTALQLPLRYTEHMALLQDYLNEQVEALISDTDAAIPPRTLLAEKEHMQKAAARVPVMAGSRWQVLARDGWKCVICGRNTIQHGVVLHVDHITPRSKGGKDEMANYQTLCEACNLGKGNKDGTDIRAHHWLS